MPLWRHTFVVVWRKTHLSHIAAIFSANTVRVPPGSGSWLFQSYNEQLNINLQQWCNSYEIRAFLLFAEIDPPFCFFFFTSCKYPRKNFPQHPPSSSRNSAGTGNSILLLRRNCYARRINTKLCRKIWTPARATINHFRSSPKEFHRHFSFFPI